MPQPAMPWPHAPTHQLAENGAYFVTAGTYLKAHHFRTPERLDALQRGLLSVTRDFSWKLVAWAVFSNHYHFVAHSPIDLENASTLSQMVGVLHTRTAEWINQVDNTPGRKVWHNFWDTKLTYQKSYLAGRWFEQIASPAMVRSIYRFKIDRLSVRDNFAPIIE